MSPPSKFDCPPEERLSHELDHGQISLNPTDSDDDSSRIVRSWVRLGDHLRELPAVSSGDLADRVRAEIRRGHPRELRLTQQRTLSREHVPSRGRNVAVFVSACTLLLVGMFVVSFSANLNSDIAMSRQPTRTTSAWEVVVVSVPDERVKLLTDELRDAVGRHGLEIHNLGKSWDRSDESLDLLMTSAESSVEFLKALNADASEIETEWNPERIGGVDRDELLSRFEASMQTPTQSDQFFGEVFVVLPKDRSIRLQPLADDGVAGRTETSIATNRNVGHSEFPVESRIDSSRLSPAVESQLAELLHGRHNHPVLVVFRRKPASPGREQGHVQPVARSQRNA